MTMEEPYTLIGIRHGKYLLDLKTKYFFLLLYISAQWNWRGTKQKQQQVVCLKTLWLHISIRRIIDWLI